MEKSIAEESLLSALLECFDKLGIDYLEEMEINGESGYQKVSSRNIVTIWEVVFCSAIVSLSIAPGRRDKSSLNRHVLGAWKKGEVNDKTEKTIRTKFIPQMSVRNGHTYIDAQRDHIISFLERAICASESTWKKDYRSANDDEYLLKKDLCDRESIRPFIYSKFENLKEFFERTPIQIISQRDSSKWFSDMVDNRIPEITSDETEQLFAAVLAAAMVLSLNIRNEIKIPSEESDSVDSNIEKYIRTLLNDEKDDLEKKSKKSVSKKTGYTVSNTINSTENGKNRIEEMVAAFNLLRTASSESEILESMIKIKRSIGRSFSCAEDVVRALPDEDEDSIYGDWMEIAYRLRDAITEYVVYYRALLEKDLLTPGIQPPDLIDMKSSVLDIVVEVYTILGFLEAQLRHELEELMRSEGKIEKEQIQMRIRKTKIDLTNIRRQNVSTETDITDALVEHRGATNYDIGTI